jgi:hypothetical protein
VFAWSALFLALGWNFLDYGINPPGDNGTVIGWLICGIVFVIMGGVPLLLLFSPRAARWSLWGPDSLRSDDLHPYKPPPLRKPKSDAPSPEPEPAPASTVHSSTPYQRSAPTATAAPVGLVPTPPPAPLPIPTPAPAEEPKATTKEGPGLVERLATLADLRERGMLDDEEYERAKAAVLDEEGSS